MNSTCPICGQKTFGKEVRGVNFCATHRNLATYLRDNADYKQHEANIGQTLRGEAFASMIQSFVRDANVLLAKQDLKVVGT